MSYFDNSIVMLLALDFISYIAVLRKSLFCYAASAIALFYVISGWFAGEQPDVIGWNRNNSRSVLDYIQNQTCNNNATFYHQIKSSTQLHINLCTKNTVLLIIVCSSVGNFEARSAIRDTCGSNELRNASKFSLYFLIGQLDHHQSQNETGSESYYRSIDERIVQESDTYGDIIQENFSDTYNNLSLKSVFMLKLVSNQCANSTKFLLKIDDDTFLNTNRLLDMLQLNSMPKHNLLAGRLIKMAKPIRDASHKWYTSSYMFANATYPLYLSGSGYLMSIDVVERLFRASLTTPIFHMEDIYVTGMCSAKAHITPRHCDLFTFTNIKAKNWCRLRNVVTAHKYNPQQIRELHSKLIGVQLLPDKCTYYRFKKYCF